jgi:hypothetical protein
MRDFNLAKKRVDQPAGFSDRFVPFGVGYRVGTGGKS